MKAVAMKAVVVNLHPSSINGLNFVFENNIDDEFFNEDELLDDNKNENFDDE